MELTLPKNQDFQVNLNFAVILPVKMNDLNGELKIDLESGVTCDNCLKLTSNTYSKKIELSETSYFIIPIIFRNSGVDLNSSDSG